MYKGIYALGTGTDLRNAVFTSEKVIPLLSGLIYVKKVRPSLFKVKYQSSVLRAIINNKEMTLRFCTYYKKNTTNADWEAPVLELKELRELVKNVNPQTHLFGFKVYSNIDRSLIGSVEEAYTLIKRNVKSIQHYNRNIHEKSNIGMILKPNTKEISHWVGFGHGVYAEFKIGSCKYATGYEESFTSFNKRSTELINNLQDSRESASAFAADMSQRSNY